MLGRSFSLSRVGGNRVPNYTAAVCRAYCKDHKGSGQDTGKLVYGMVVAKPKQKYEVQPRNPFRIKNEKFVQATKKQTHKNSLKMGGNKQNLSKKGQQTPGQHVRHELRQADASGDVLKIGMENWHCDSCGTVNTDSMSRKCGHCKAQRPMHLGNKCKSCKQPLSVDWTGRCPACGVDHPLSRQDFPHRNSFSDLTGHLPRMVELYVGFQKILKKAQQHLYLMPNVHDQGDLDDGAVPPSLTVSKQHEQQSHRAEQESARGVLTMLRPWVCFSCGMVNPDADLTPECIACGQNDSEQAASLADVDLNRMNLTMNEDPYDPYPVIWRCPRCATVHSKRVVTNEIAPLPRHADDISEDCTEVSVVESNDSLLAEQMSPIAEAPSAACSICDTGVSVGSWICFQCWNPQPAHTSRCQFQGCGALRYFRGTQWMCTSCQNITKAPQAQCDHCGCDAEAVQAGHGWTCHPCGAFNLAWDTFCHQCRQFRPDGFEVRERAKSRGRAQAKRPFNRQLSSKNGESDGNVGDTDGENGFSGPLFGR
eukprot:Clim_evm33s251 gene=Clim_evmTU33s251